MAQARQLNTEVYVQIDLSAYEANLVLGALEVERDAHLEMLDDPKLENREATQADLDSYERLMEVLKPYVHSTQR